MTEPEMIEGLAEAIYEVSPVMGGSNVPHKPHGETYRWAEWKAVAPAEIVENTYREARAAAAAYKRALAASGYVIVPREPTEGMLNAARDWSLKKYGQGVGNDGAAGCWQAMQAAALATEAK